MSGARADANIEAFYAEGWVSQNETREAHSANISMSGNTPVTVWYGGTEEGHKDVAIYMSTFDGQWAQPTVVATRESSERQLDRYIRKVGNPALHSWPDGTLGVFYVTVSFGGWAASNINYVQTSDLGQTWTAPRRLVTSPFLNISTLVRAHGLDLTSGGLHLPVYHEFLGKFSELLHLDKSGGEVLDKTRLSRGKHSLQPAIANLSDTEVIGILRYAGNPPNRLLSTHSVDGGRHWTEPVTTDLPNPNSAIALLNIGDDRLLMALNDTEDGRHKLSLAVREEGIWTILKKIEDEAPESEGHDFEFSYPSLAMDADGLIHMVYTWNQTRIKHVTFNQHWLLSSFMAEKAEL